MQQGPTPQTGGQSRIQRTCRSIWFNITKHRRGLVLLFSLGIWGFGLNVALQIGLFDETPRFLLFLTLFGPCVGVLWFGWTHKKWEKWYSPLPPLWRRSAVALAWVIVITCGLGCWRFAFKEKIKPHLVVVLKSPYFPELSIELTNKLLFGNDLKKSQLVASVMLALPVPAEESAATFRFVVSNMEGEKTADGFSVGVTFSEDLECTLGEGWAVSSSTAPNTKSVLFQTEQKLFQRTSRVLNDIGLKHPGGWKSSQVTLIALSIVSDGMVSEPICMKLKVFVGDPRMKPQLLLPDEPYKFPQ